MLESDSIPKCPDGPEASFGRLTMREREVTDYLTRGRSNKYIAVELGVTQRTIEAHRARIFQKLRVRNVVELTRYCLSRRAGAPDAGTGDPGSSAGGGAAAAPGISARRRLRPVSRPVPGWGRYPPGGSAAIPARGPGRPGGSGARRSAG